jgi:hypothetical protein
MGDETRASARLEVNESPHWQRPVPEKVRDGFQSQRRERQALWLWFDREGVISSVGVRSVGLKFLEEKVARASIPISPVPYELSGL